MIYEVLLVEHTFGSGWLPAMAEYSGGAYFSFVFIFF
jgi:hypothetical protein